MMKLLIEELTQKQANLSKSLNQAATRELVAEKSLQDARATRATVEGAKQQVDEFLNRLLELRDAPASAEPKPAPKP